MVFFNAKSGLRLTDSSISIYVLNVSSLRSRMSLIIMWLWFYLMFLLFLCFLAKSIRMILWTLDFGCWRSYEQSSNPSISSLSCRLKFTFIYCRDTLCHFLGFLSRINWNLVYPLLLLEVLSQVEIYPSCHEHDKSFIPRLELWTIWWLYWSSDCG